MAIKKNYKTIFTVAQTAKMKGIENAHQLHERTGISIPRSRKLWIGKCKVDLDDLDALCDKLPCRIKDIIQRVPTSFDDILI